MCFSSFSRRVFVAGFLALAGMVGMAPADAQDIRYFVRQSKGLYEITAQATGGNFVVAPTGEKISVPGIGVLPVQGRTDRASRGETVVTQLRGSGQANVKVSYTPERGSTQTIFAGPVNLPLVLPRMVSMSSNVDNLVVAVTQNGRTTSRRLPIGTR